MNHDWTTEKLLAFEAEVAEMFRRGDIRAPIHLGDGSEEGLIRVFQEVKPQDWVLAGWRSHYHCLLKGVPPGELMEAILRGRSVSLSFPSHKVLCSGIVGGIAPIACGIAHQLRQRDDADPTGNGAARVWCFLGDMAWCNGAAMEAYQYAKGHDLPITFVVEDNGRSVMTNTRESWGSELLPRNCKLTTFSYIAGRPHSGIGEWVRF